jgi:hypothetical protein
MVVQIDLYEFNTISSTHYFSLDYALHDMLTIIQNRLNTMSSHHFSDLFLCVNEVQFNKRFPILLNKYVFDEVTLTIRDIYIIDEDTENVKNILDLNNCIHSHKIFNQICSKLSKKTNSPKPLKPQKTEKDLIIDTINNTLLSTTQAKSHLIFDDTTVINVVKNDIPVENNIIVKDDNLNTNNTTHIINNELIKQIENSDSDNVNNQFILDTMALLQNEMDNINKLKERELAKLKKHEDNHKQDLDNFVEFSADVRDKENIKKKNKERKIELQRIFDSDKKIFLKISSQIDNNEISEDNIPELFQDKFPIFKIMKEQDTFDGDTFDVYYDLIKSHNVNNINTKLSSQLDLENDIIRIKSQ